MNTQSKQFRVYSNGVAGDFYLAQPRSKSTVVFLPGLPGSMKKNDLGVFLAAEGNSLFNLEYPGTFNSPGTLTPDSCVEGAVRVFQLLQKGSIADAFSKKKYRTTRQIVFAGTSFGSVVALLAAARLKEVQKLILFSPVFFFSSNPKESGMTEDLDGLLKYLKDCLPFTHRLDKENEWKALFSGKHSRLRVQAQLKALDGKSILVVRGAGDTSINSTAVGRFHKALCDQEVKCNLKVLSVAEGSHDYRSLLNKKVKKAVLDFLAVDV